MGDSNYLTDRVPDLNSQGGPAGSDKNMLYYSNDDIKIQSVQFDINQGKYIQSLTSKTFSSSSECTIPNNDSISNFYLHLALAPLAQHLTLSDAWGYASIRSINYTWGLTNFFF